MSRSMDHKRAMHLGLTGGLALVLLAAAVFMTVLDARNVWQPDVSGPVLPDWEQTVAGARQIEIRGENGSFILARTDQGWIMPSRDDRPVIAGRLAELDAWLAGLIHAGSLTANPDKYARLGVADSGSEGAATQLRVTGEGGTVLADILLGHSRDGRLYFRRPDDPRVYVARHEDGVAAQPDIAEATAWLELDFLALGDNEIARADVEPETGPAYRLERPGRATRNFALRQPTGWTPITAGAGNGPANTLSRVRFRDVRNAERLDGEIVARHTAETFLGLRVHVDVLALGDTRWALIEAVALTDEVEEAASAINAAAAGWAFLLSDLTIDRLLRPLDRIADRSSAVESPGEP